MRIVGALALSAALGLALAGCASQPKSALTGATPTPSEASAPPSTGENAFEDQSRPVPESLQQEFAQTIGDRVFFELDSFTLSAEARETLGRQASWLIRHPQVKVMVAGNCDERGTREYNFALGSRRSNAAAQFLVANGVSSTRIRTISYGKERPLETASNEAAWARNRNSQTVLIDLGPS